MKAGYESLIFSKQLGLIAWLHESMSGRNPSSRSASSPNVEEKKLHSFSLCWMPRKGLYRSSHHLKPISQAKDLDQELKPKTFGTWEATDIAKRRVKHHPFRHCLSRFFMSEDDLQCALYSTLYSGRFQRKFLQITTQSWYDIVPYCVHDITCRSATYRIMELRLGLECIALQSSVRVS